MLEFHNFFRVMGRYMTHPMKKLVEFQHTPAGHTPPTGMAVSVACFTLITYTSAFPASNRMVSLQKQKKLYYIL
jgi:hypothetical protein